MTAYVPIGVRCDILIDDIGIFNLTMIGLSKFGTDIRIKCASETMTKGAS
jgi:hypothetical protein